MCRGSRCLEVRAPISNLYLFGQSLSNIPLYFLFFIDYLPSPHYYSIPAESLFKDYNAFHCIMHTINFVYDFSLNCILHFSNNKVSFLVEEEEIYQYLRLMIKINCHKKDQSIIGGKLKNGFYL